MSEQQEKPKTPKPGQYSAKLLDYAISTTKEGKPQVVAVFEFDDSNGDHFQRTWAGSLNHGKAREITLKALKAMGLQGGEEKLPHLAYGVDSGELSLTKRVQITVADEQNPNTLEWSSRIKWVNEIGGPMMGNRLSPDAAKDLLARMLGIGAQPGFGGVPDDQTVPF